MQSEDVLDLVQRAPLQAVPTLSCSELELHGACVLELHPFLCQTQSRAINELGCKAGVKFSRLWIQQEL